MAIDVTSGLLPRAGSPGVESKVEMDHGGDTRGPIQATVRVTRKQVTEVSKDQEDPAR